ncbi:MAG: fumarylacetoacetate hydrolase family protein [Bacteroidaceae bacterium]|nr:fumarylacetoacetate hydrolase family protein [Bacteroidaceae bacterium]
MKIICVGMNYPRHNKELGETLLKPESPVIFMKPDSSILRNRKPFFLPDHMGRIEYETELVVRIDRLGKSIGARFADRYWDAVTLGIDFTAREMQNDLRRKGLPWELCKGFDQSAVIGDWVPKEKVGELQNLHFGLDIDGQRVQDGYTGDMIFTVGRIIEYVSSFCTLKTGDLIFTGTPAGVGPVSIGQHLQGFLEGENVLDFHIR